MRPRSRKRGAKSVMRTPCALSVEELGDQDRGVGRRSAARPRQVLDLDVECAARANRTASPAAEQRVEDRVAVGSRQAAPDDATVRRQALNAQLPMTPSERFGPASGDLAHAGHALAVGRAPGSAPARRRALRSSRRTSSVVPRLVSSGTAPRRSPRSRSTRIDSTCGERKPEHVLVGDVVADVDRTLAARVHEQRSERVALVRRIRRQQVEHALAVDESGGGTEPRDALARAARARCAGFAVAWR